MVHLENVLKTSWRCLEDVLKTFSKHLEDVLKMSWGRLEDVLKTSSEDVWVRRIYSSWSRRLEDVLKKSSEDEDERRLQDVFIKTNVCWVLGFNKQWYLVRRGISLFLLYLSTQESDYLIMPYLNLVLYSHALFMYLVN